MKILAIADPHGDPRAMKEIKKKAKQADLILVAGDFTLFEHDIKRIIKEYDTLKKPVLIIQGNHEDPHIVKALCESSKNLIYADEAIYEQDDVQVLSIEGNGFVQKDPHFEMVAENLKKAINPNKKLILQTHAPPYKTVCDRIWDGDHCGNESIRKFIEKVQPIIAICGHIHENNATEDKIGKTKVINPGPNGRIIEV
ncbi:MAG: metallophosphoesterase family protein [Nanobdellota archaeon]